MASEDEGERPRRSGERERGEKESRREKRRRSSSSSSSSSSRSSSSPSDDDRKRKRKDKKSKDMDNDDKKKRKEEKKRKKEKRAAKKAKKEAKKAAKKAAEAALSSQPAAVSNPITPDDYFAKATEFRVWLKEVRTKFLDELSGTKARKYFNEFAGVWNAGKLPEKYYKGMRETGLDAGERTRYKWGFAKHVDSMQLASIRDTIDTETNRQAAQAAAFRAAPPPAATGTNNIPLGGGPGGAGPGGSRPMVKPRDPAELEEEREGARLMYKRERKALERQHKETMEELVPKPDPGSFAARLEKKAAKGTYAKGERDVEPEYSERDLMGGGDDFKARLARERQWRERQTAQRQDSMEAKRAAYEAKEREKIEALRALIRPQ